MEYGHSYERQWLHTSAYALGAYARGPSCAPRILCRLGGKNVKKSLGKKTGWRLHNGGWDYVGALGIPYSGSASLNRISERISACLCDRALAICGAYSHPPHVQRHGLQREGKLMKEKKKREKENNGNEKGRKNVDPVITAVHFLLFISFARCIDTCAFRGMRDWTHAGSCISGELTTRRLEDPRG